MPFHIDFRIVLSFSVRHLAEIWIEIALGDSASGGRRQQHGGRARAAQPSSSRLSSSPPPESLGPFSLHVLVVSPLPPRHSSGLPSLLPFTATASPSVGPAGNSHSHPTPPHPTPPTSPRAGTMEDVKLEFPSLPQCKEDAEV